MQNNISKDIKDVRKDRPSSDISFVRSEGIIRHPRLSAPSQSPRFGMQPSIRLPWILKHPQNLYITDELERGILFGLQALESSQYIKILM